MSEPETIKCFACSVLLSGIRSVYCVADFWRGGRPARHLCGPCFDAEPALSAPAPSCVTCGQPLDQRRMNDPNASMRWDLCASCVKTEGVRQFEASGAALKVRMEAAAAVAACYELLKPTTLVWCEIITDVHATGAGRPLGGHDPRWPVVQAATKERSEPITPFGRSLRRVMVHSTADMRWWMTEYGDRCADFDGQQVSILEQVERIAAKHPEIVAKHVA